MSELGYTITISILLLYFVTEHEATAPLFLQAITSALATIPFTGGPMTTGLVGAKLAIGTKLLYYLGYFGRSSKSAPIPVPSKSAPPKPVGGPFAGGAGGYQPFPLPYFLAGAGQAGNNFQQMGNGFGIPQNQGPYGGFDPAEIFQALIAQGYDPNTAMQMMNYGGGGAGGFAAGGAGAGAFSAGLAGAGLAGAGGFNAAGAAGGFGSGNVGTGGFSAGEFDTNPPQAGAFPPFQPNPAQIPDFETTPDASLPSTGEGASQSQDLGSEDVESFFTFLKDMDENTCISRLICDIGDNPSFLGDFSENIHSIIRSLDVQPTSGAYLYMEIMETGRKEGGCNGKFPQCSDSAYEIVKNVAPSVGVPQNIGSAALNQL